MSEASCESQRQNFSAKEGFTVSKFLMVTLLFATMTFCGCAGHFGKSPKLIIGIDEEFAPLSFHNEENELVGFEIELAKEAAQRLGMEPEFKPIAWNNKREEITSGNIDLIWNGLDITDARKEYMIFSKPYMNDRQVLLVKADDDFDIYSEHDLEGKIVGVQAGSISDDYINQNEKLKSSFKGYKAYVKFNDVIDALMTGGIDIIICDEIIARYKMNSYPDKLKIINVKVGIINETGIGFRKDNVELRDKVQAVFDEMIKDGTAKKISLKWFGADLILYK